MIQNVANLIKAKFKKNNYYALSSFFFSELFSLSVWQNQRLISNKYRYLKSTPNQHNWFSDVLNQFKSISERGFYTINV